MSVCLCLNGWICVCLGVREFVWTQADPVMILTNDNVVVITSNRLHEGGVPQLEPGMVVGQLALADALIIGNCNNQVHHQGREIHCDCEWGLFSEAVHSEVLQKHVGSTGAEDLSLHQVKFSELTIDMFRMLQALEREPVTLATQSNKTGTLVSTEHVHTQTHKLVYLSKWRPSLENP